MPGVHVIVLAAGDGTRMRSATPKVLHPLLGRAMVRHVVDAARAAGAVSLVLVVSPRTEEPLRAACAGLDARFVRQDPPRGTGDAAALGMGALPEIDDAARVIVINGDCPGIRPATLAALAAAEADGDGVFLTVELDDPTGYGRVVRDGAGRAAQIIEEDDCTQELRALREVNAGVYCFRAASLRRALAALTTDNAQGELYLTDTLEAIRAQGGTVALHRHPDPAEVHGVNTRAELARAEELLLERKLDALMTAGVTIRGASAVRVDVDVEVGRDTVLYPGVVLESGSVLGEGCTIYPGVRIARSRIGDRVVVYDGSVVEDATVESDVALGPYARLRPGAHICEHAKVGNFVEIKATRLGKGSKANHLTYLGNAEIGERVNVGAGTITCNYDGVHKHTTVIEDGAFIGSNTALVAPVRIGAGAYVGAGSTITKDVPPGSLGVARGRQVVREDWARRKAPGRGNEAE